MPFYGFQSIGCGTGNVNKIFWLDRNNAALKEQFSPEWNRAYLGLIRHGMELQKARQWPEILWYVSDERSNYREVGAKQGVELAKLVRQVPGAVSIASMNGPWEHIMVPYLDISMPNIAFPITDETLELLKKHQSKLWLYNCGRRLTAFIPARECRRAFQCITVHMVNSGTLAPAGAVDMRSVSTALMASFQHWQHKTFGRPCMIIDTW